MKPILVLGAVLLAWSAPAFADNFEGCDKDEALIIQEAMRNAKALTLKAATAVGDTPDYDRWFGDYTRPNAEQVRANLKAIVTAIRGGGVTAQCHSVRDNGCNAGEYAWVYAHEPYLMHMCPPFFTLPPLVALQPGARSSDDGTREGTVVHELSHFIHVANTEDHCYSRRDCSDMASYDAERAIDNADSYQYYTEDVTYYARQPVAGKPTSADRAD